MRALTLLGFGISFTGGAVTGLTVVYGVQALDLPDTGAGIGLLFSAAALGSLASSVLLPRLNRRYATGSITLARPDGGRRRRRGARASRPTSSRRSSSSSPGVRRRRS